MSEFSLESLAEKIYDVKTKNYFQEVLSSYQNGNYRSAVVMLWSVAICDIVYKLQSLVDLYDDQTAKLILGDSEKLQEANPKSSDWEIKLVKSTFDKTMLLDNPEYANLETLQTQRHLSAHPVLKNEHRELYSPNKETVRSLMRNTLEDLLIKPPFYTKKIINELLKDIAESKAVLDTKKKVKKYIEDEYLNRLKPEVEIEIYKNLWKLVFRLDDNDCKENRLVNRQILEVIGNRNSEEILKAIKNEKDYYSKISLKEKILDHLVIYLSKNHSIYELLNDGAKIKIKHHLENTNRGRICGFFLKEDSQQYYEDIISLINEKSDLILKDSELNFLLKISDTPEWEQLFCRIISTYYGASGNGLYFGFDRADSRFQQAISPYLELFDKETIIFLLQQIEQNPQTYGRKAAKKEHEEIKNKIFQLYGEEFDWTPYPHFSNNMVRA
jgi:hypothetical protein